MAGFFYENRKDMTWDGVVWDAGTIDYSCWRNVDTSVMKNCVIKNTRLKTAASHGEGLKIDLANNCRIYRTLFESNDVMHLFLSYPFWGTSLNGVAHESASSDITIEECGFGKGHVSQFGHAFYYHIQRHPDARLSNIVFKNCFRQEGADWWGGPTTGVTFTNIMTVPAGSDMAEHMRNYANEHTDNPPPPPPPPPPPVDSVEARLLKLESDANQAKANAVKLASDLGILTARVDAMAEGGADAYINKAIEQLRLVSGSQTAIRGTFDALIKTAKDHEARLKG